MDVQPLGDRLIVDPLEEEETTVSGIVLPDTAKEKPQRGRVLAVGPVVATTVVGFVPMEVAAGDEVIYSKYGGTEIKLGADDVLILRESDVLAKVVSSKGSKSTKKKGSRGRYRLARRKELTHGTQGTEVQRGGAALIGAGRQHPRRRGQGHPWPEGSVRRSGQEVRGADDYERRRHDRT